jgi:4-hydroxy-tetrahydrodipicolinate reductase
VFEHRSRLIKGATLDPDWSSDLQGGWTVEVTGRPDVRAAVRLSFDISSMEEFTGLGLVATAMPAVNAIRNVVAARPGIVTYLDVDVATARGFVRV